jgi:hypothetical protein
MQQTYMPMKMLKKTIENTTKAATLDLSLLSCTDGLEPSREKGACENTNYLIRDMLYPVNDFRQLIQREASKIARLLNERPRKTLDFRTPYEAFSELR